MNRPRLLRWLWRWVDRESKTFIVRQSERIRELEALNNELVAKEVRRNKKG